MVIKWDDSAGAPRFERLLVELSGTPRTWAVISLDGDFGMPILRTADEIVKGLTAGTAAVAEDPYIYIAGLTDEDLSEAQKAAKNEAWRILKPFVANNKDYPLLFKETRGTAIQDTAQKHKIPVPKLYAWIRRYYQRGQSEFALAPDYQLCGARGEDRGCTDAKRGRPPKYGKEVVNITPAIAKKVCQGLDEFYARKKYSFADALKKTKQVYFCKSFRVEGSRKIYTLEPIAELITPGQARYHFLKHRDLPALTRQRLGAKKYDKDVRGITGNSTSMAWGPGALYMIDATIADTHLRHPWTNEPLGRPTVYLVVDVYTHMVVGFYVTYEPTSLIAAALAIEQAVRNKAEVLKELELEIHPELWPAEGIPYAIMADRGELISANSDSIPQALECVLENTKAYRADAKGLVEQAFRQTNLHTIQWTDGFVSKNRDRDDADPKKTTSVHPRAFCRALAIGLINRNLDLLDSYPLAKEHYNDGVPARPLELWKWGMDKQTGLLRSITTKQLYRKLLPRATATATRIGLLFKGVTFTNERLHKKDWFSLAGIKNRKSLTIAYDPRSLANTFLVPDQFGAELEPLELTPKWKDKHYGELSWRELEALFKERKSAKVVAAGEDLARGINTRAYQEQILEGSREHFNGNKNPSVSGGLTAKDHFRRLETQLNGAANVPVDPTQSPASLESEKPSASRDEEDEEHELIAEQLLHSLDENTHGH